eukprot:GEZU01024748.1.p1 GENE.GEZU01024748.1~~GEZU01024748.1.p1  ORF type:complete len:238 (-),score=40.41 GEZU01024748.1:183-896(-)
MVFIQPSHFRVVFCSSQDHEHNAQELNSRTSATKGWQSSRFCYYPQEVGLALPAPMKVAELQLLLHEYKIPSKIEFYAGLDNAANNKKSKTPADYYEDDEVGYQLAVFKYLGFIIPSDNRASHYTTRELKNMKLDATLKYLKIIFHDCYRNEINVYRQIGLIAVNILAIVTKSKIDTEISTKEQQYSELEFLADLGYTASGKLIVSGAYDDDDTKLDSFTTEKIKEIRKRKDQAIRG